jgi:hypothetical protein
VNANLQTIENHLDNIEVMIKAYEWGKDVKECFAEIEKSACVIRTRVNLIKESA